ncbi:glyoxalase/bleomycin resistance/dioxygenase family protein [Amylibacter sp. SFDW26]|uniref:VOC family protein n=1 Tax=Amylibacter sp. SFDW26 TaxID=2652722 RepID=UPI001262481A|nr:VOC family protein [Amylibacter sp. SFDW26]KAB7615761.1 glyoxalase/bleomycin resistance/dioxygenase family protein [Amylibacter sp. SFDW26]
MQFERTGIILFTYNYDACVSFYTKILGLPVLFSINEGDTHLTCCDFFGAYLMIETGGPDAQHTKTMAQNPTKLRFNVADVENAAQELESKGIIVQRGVFDWGTIANFTDPDGNMCSLRDQKTFSEQMG